MNEAGFQRLVEAAFAELPAEFREACHDVAIRVEPLPDAEVLAALEMHDGYELLGLYHGINLAQKSVFDVSVQPDMVFLYRLPIIAYAKATHRPLAVVVRHVLTHELGHHFGFSDADMDAIEAADD
jgi:predicted Zn-dependent protease with MMP-like domain